MIAAMCRPSRDGALHRIRLTGSSAIFSRAYRKLIGPRILHRDSARDNELLGIHQSHDSSQQLPSKIASCASSWPLDVLHPPPKKDRHGIRQFRLMIKTVLSSIRYSSPICRKRSSRLTAYSSSALQMSFGVCRLCSRMTISSWRRSSLSLPS
jgi:hypothetical protein